MFAMIAAITTRLSSSSEQQTSINDMFKLFVQGDVSPLDQNIQIDSLPIFGHITVNDESTWCMAFDLILF
ncbi:hypothetical protein G6F42_028931 [Rhizopus arrhizus]|nr:hypothetical protein G6F42_028931 [Rhizopus arrhizus]